MPGLNRLQISPVGVFTVTIGPQTPAFNVLIPSGSLDTLVNLDTKLMQDSEYVKAAADVLNAPAREPAFHRMESWLLQAFEGWPKIRVPAATVAKAARVFELRTYESPSQRDLDRKKEMMNGPEFKIFEKAGFSQVFYSTALIGSRLPSLTYMVGFDTLAERENKWNAFFSSPEWKKLSSDLRYSFEPTVSNVTNLILTPTAYSQI